MATQSASAIAVKAAKEGDEVAFQLLLEPLLGQAYRLACGLLHDHQAAEDAVQEAAFNAWRKLPQLREGSEMRPWFFAIVANECRSATRSRWWSVIRAVVPEPITQQQDEAIVAGVELRQALRAMDADKSGAGLALARLKALTVYGYFTSKPVEQDILKVQMYFNGYQGNVPFTPAV